MLTPTEITAGATRLVAGKLKIQDVDQLVSIFRMFFRSLETVYNYQFEAKLLALDDTGSTKETCAQIGACLDKMEEFGFGVARLEGGRDSIFFKEKDRYWQYVCIAFTKIYPMPSEVNSDGTIRYLSSTTNLKSNRIRGIRSMRN